MAGKIIIAVDFGTTFSAIGYTYFEDGMKITDLELNIVDKGWPGQGRRKSPKIPSVFKLDSGTFSYGFKVANDPERVSFAKLFLDPKQLAKAQHLAKIHSVAGYHSANNLATSVTMFLQALREYAFQMMLKKWDQDFIDSKPKEYVLSVPAIWSESARGRTLECALNAGLGERDSPLSIRLVSEPEAAAVYTITKLPDCTLRTSDIFMTCDAGGGTVDLTSYKITALNPHLQVEEAALGTGGLCGSVALNVRFAEFVEKKIGKLEAADMNEMQIYFNDNSISCARYQLNMLAYLIHADRLTVPTHIPDNESTRVQDGSLVMMANDVKGIFDPVIRQILILIQSHREENRQALSDRKIPILLVGGFGSSKYLKAKIEGEYPDAPVLQPPEAWSAVVRGALLRAIVRKRKIRAFYGVKFRETWTKELHEGEAPLAKLAAKNKVYDEFEQKYRCANRMEWYVKKGEEFDSVKTVAFPFYRNVGIHHSLEFEIDLWAYSEGREGSDGPPFHDADCRRIAIMRPDLSSIPRKSLPRGKSPRGDYFKVEYELLMSFDTMIEFKLKYKDQIEKRVQVDYMESEDGANLRE